MNRVKVSSEKNKAIVPVNKKLMTGTDPVNKELLTRTVPVSVPTVF